MLKTRHGIVRLVVVVAVLVAALVEKANAISCYVCNTTDSALPFQCGEWFDRYDTPDIEPQDCADVHDARYCIKHVGRFGGGIGAIRFCSSRDLGNYCNYVQNVGDQMEYRSCYYTCDTDGCNAAQRPATAAAAIFLAVGAVLTLATAA